MDIRVVFMGTPDFAALVLSGLIDKYNVVGVVSQPDKIIGRSREKTFTPVKKLAIENNITVLQPEKVRSDYDDILALKPDIIITCAYGQIIPKALLDYPKYGCINVHASLLPKLRGGAPIHRSIIEGDKKTGITIMYMDKGMDTGDMISKMEVEISNLDTAATLHDKLMKASVKLLEKTLPSIVNGTNEREKQDDSKATYAYNVSREEEHINFNNNALDIYNQIRGLNSWPGAYSNLEDKQVKIWSSTICEKKFNSEPGTIEDIDKSGMLISTKDKSILITEIQMPGKKKTKVKDFINGIKKEDYIGKCFN